MPPRERYSRRVIPDGHRPCPKCRPARTLSVFQASGPEGDIRVDLCGHCRGVWCDWGEIGELHELVKLLPPGVSIPGTSGASSYKRDLMPGVCPSCDTHPRLTPLLIGAFHVDRCDECLGLWFDGGELGPMLTEQGFASLLATLRSHPA